MPLNKQNITINEDRKDDDDEKKNGMIPYGAVMHDNYLS